MNTARQGVEYFEHPVCCDSRLLCMQVLSNDSSKSCKSVCSKTQPFYSLLGRLFRKRQRIKTGIETMASGAGWWCSCQYIDNIHARLHTHMHLPVRL